ncbi:MAG TPA: nitrate reductase [Chromatiales bacterium]|nr:nitrate reductase [Chromatiales bacterium]
MTLLDFATGPALTVALAVFLLGTLWRLLGALFLRRRFDLSAPRVDGAWKGGVRTIFTRFWSHPEFRGTTVAQMTMSYLFHIGLFVVVFLFVPHIEFIEGLAGLSWPGLPNDVVLAAGVVTVAVAVALLVRRLTHPVLRMVSNADDYISLVVTVLPVLTGLMAFTHFGMRYETLLGLHVLSVDLLLIWFPFGKLMHAVLFVPSRAQMGAAFARRGIKA